MRDICDNPWGVLTGFASALEIAERIRTDVKCIADDLSNSCQRRMIKGVYDVSREGGASATEILETQSGTSATMSKQTRILPTLYPHISFAYYTS